MKFVRLFRYSSNETGIMKERGEKENGGNAYLAFCEINCVYFSRAR